MNKFLLICVLITSTTSIFSQKLDYRDIRFSLFLLPCGTPDSFSVMKSIQNLESFDTTQIGKHMNEYYTDLAICYFLLSNGKESQYYLNASNKANRSALYHKSDDSKALWNCAFGYYRLDDCDTGKNYMDLYKKHTKEKYWDKEEMTNLEKRCL